MWEIVFVTSMVVLVFVIVTLFIYYLFTRKRYKAQKQHFEDLHMNLKPGQKVEFANGLIGTIKSTGTEYCTIEIESGGVIKVSRYAISRRIEE